MSGYRDLTTEQAIAWVLDPRNDSGNADSTYVMAANYDPNGEEGEWDGLAPEDIETWQDEIDEGDLSGFAEWGPFRLVWEGDKDPGEPRDWTPEEAIERLAGFLGVFEHHSPTLDLAVDVLDKFVTQVRDHGSTDLEWGEPGDCQDRIDNDTDENNGRHYGDPHCIWCLQAS